MFLPGNAHINAPSRDKIWTHAGKEFGSNEGCIMIIVWALYGLKQVELLGEQPLHKSF